MDSYILNNQDTKLVQFILKEINNSTYFKTPNLSKLYINKVLEIKYSNITENIRRSTSIRIGKIIQELKKLGIIKKHSGTAKSIWKNLHKNQLYVVLNEKMEQQYLIIKMKK